MFKGQKVKSRTLKLFRSYICLSTHAIPLHKHNLKPILLKLGSSVMIIQKTENDLQDFAKSCKRQLWVQQTEFSLLSALLDNHLKILC